MLKANKNDFMFTVKTIIDLVNDTVNGKIRTGYKDRLDNLLKKHVYIELVLAFEDAVKKRKGHILYPYALFDRDEEITGPDSFSNAYHAQDIISPKILSHLIINKHNDIIMMNQIEYEDIDKEVQENRLNRIDILFQDVIKMMKDKQHFQKNLIPRHLWTWYSDGVYDFDDLIFKNDGDEKFYLRHEVNDRGIDEFETELLEHIPSYSDKIEKTDEQDKFTYHGEYLNNEHSINHKREDYSLNDAEFDASLSENFIEMPIDFTFEVKLIPFYDGQGVSVNLIYHVSDEQNQVHFKKDAYDSDVFTVDVNNMNFYRTTDTIMLIVRNKMLNDLTEE